MKLILIFLVATLILSTRSYTQEIPASPFKDDLIVTDVKAILKSVADWQINTPLTHAPADPTNGALYAGMVKWADIYFGQGFLKVDGKQIVDGKGNPVLLRGIGLGGWMLQEPYMLQLSKVAGTQIEIKSKIAELIGEDNCLEFYRRYLKNMITQMDIDSLKEW